MRGMTIFHGWIMTVSGRQLGGLYFPKFPIWDRARSEAYHRKKNEEVNLMEPRDVL